MAKFMRYKNGDMDSVVWLNAMVLAVKGIASSINVEPLNQVQRLALTLRVLENPIYNAQARAEMEASLQLKVAGMTDRASEVIYLDLTRSPLDIASTLVHELNHAYGSFAEWVGGEQVSLFLNEFYAHLAQAFFEARAVTPISLVDLSRYILELYNLPLEAAMGAESHIRRPDYKCLTGGRNVNRKCLDHINESTMLSPHDFVRELIRPEMTPAPALLWHQQARYARSRADRALDQVDFANPNADGLQFSAAPARHSIS